LEVFKGLLEIGAIMIKMLYEEERFSISFGRNT
jgi:hypothetical protein